MGGSLAVIVDVDVTAPASATATRLVSTTRFIASSCVFLLQCTGQCGVFRTRLSGENGPISVMASRPASRVSARLSRGRRAGDWDARTARRGHVKDAQTADRESPAARSSDWRDAPWRCAGLSLWRE